jgi:hypothetical protein
LWSADEFFPAARPPNYVPDELSADQIVRETDGGP